MKPGHRSHDEADFVASFDRFSPRLVAACTPVAALAFLGVAQNVTLGCPNVSDQVSGPSLVDVLKIAGALIAIIAGILSAVVDAGPKWVKYAGATLIVLGTSFSFLVDKQKDHDDDIHRSQLLACVEQIEANAIDLQKLTAQSRSDQLRLLAQQETTNTTAQKIVRGLRDVDASTRDTSQRLSQNVALSRNNLEGTRQALSNTNLLRRDTGVIVKQADGILTEVDDTVYPFKNIRYSWETRINLAAPQLRAYRDLLRSRAKAFFAGHFEGMAFTEPYTPPGGRRRLVFHLGSPLMPTGEALGAVLGFDLQVDIFKQAPAAGLLNDLASHSPDYSAILVPPYIGEFYDQYVGEKKFPRQGYRKFEVSYFPDNDDCFVEYYVDAPLNVDVNTANSAVSIVGLPDLRAARYVIRTPMGTSDLSKTWTTELNWVRLRIDSQELALRASAFRRTVSQSKSMSAHGQQVGAPIWVYSLDFPVGFQNVKDMFSTVRSDVGAQPVDETPVAEGV